MKRGLLISGGGTKISGHAGFISALEESGIEFSDVAGVSAGAIIAPFAAIGSVSENRDLFTSITPDDFWKCAPTTPKGKLRLRAIIRFLKGESLGDFSNLEKTLRIHFPEACFEILKELRRFVYSEAVDMRTGGVEISSSMWDVYPMFIRGIVASASIPIFTKAFPRADGGLRNHLPVKSLNHMHDIKELFVLWARPEKLDGVLDPEYGRSEPPNQIEQLERTISIMNLEISKNDQQYLRNWCKRKGVVLHEFYQPKVMNGVYDTSFENQRRLFDTCYYLAQSRIQNSGILKST